MSQKQPPSVETNPSVLLTVPELRSTGLLWLINSSVLHPRGLALGIDDTDPEHLTLFFNADPNEVVAYGPGPDGDTAWLDDCLARFNEFVADLRRQQT